MASGKMKEKPISKPLPHGKRLLVTQKLKKDIEEIQLCAAQALGFQTASVASKSPEALSTIIQKLSAMQDNIDVLDEIRREVSALYNELKSTEAHLRSKGESADLLPLEKTSLIEKMAELERSFTAEFEDEQDDSNDSKESQTENRDAVLDDKHFDDTSPASRGSEELTVPVSLELDDENPTQEPSDLAVPSLSTTAFPPRQVRKSVRQQKPGYQAEQQQQQQQQQHKQQQTYVKKPLNAYMLFLKEQRPHVKAEANSKTRMPVTAFLGDQWKALPKKQKAKYFKEAEQQRLLHRQQNPGWSNKVNYGKKLTKAQKKKLEGE